LGGWVVGFKVAADDTSDATQPLEIVEALGSRCPQ
jgi:hypothetical protein